MTENEYIRDLTLRATESAAKAREKFPQPNYTLLKVGEEAGEVVRAGVHLAEGRDCTHADLEGEIVQTMAMLIRLAVEGDQVNGVPSIYGELHAGAKA